MRTLTPEERATYERHSKHLAEIREEIELDVRELAELYGVMVPTAEAIDYAWVCQQLEEPLKLEGFSTATTHQRQWVAARLMVLIGQYFVTQWRGKWNVQGDPTKPYFLEIVVDHFEGSDHEKLIVWPLGTVEFYMDSPPGRSLARMLADRTISYPD
jgi:hypothetical protein